jgi:hypothetical protein
MKTHGELLGEARRIETLGGNYAAAYEQLFRRDATARLAPLSVFSFVDTTLWLEPATLASRYWLEVAMVGGAPEYHLMRQGAGEEPTLVMASDSAFDLLSEGYELSEKERLVERQRPRMTIGEP